MCWKILVIHLWSIGDTWAALLICFEVIPLMIQHLLKRWSQLCSNPFHLMISEQLSLINQSHAWLNSSKGKSLVVVLVVVVVVVVVGVAAAALTFFLKQHCHRFPLLEAWMQYLPCIHQTTIDILQKLGSQWVFLQPILLNPPWPFHRLYTRKKYIHSIYPWTNTSLMHI